MFSLETEMHARYVCDMSSVQHSALRGYVRASTVSTVWTSLCESVWMYRECDFVPFFSCLSLIFSGLIASAAFLRLMHLYGALH